ncbi:MAG: TonB-dependent receptor [Ignavibacteriales bacterium]|nr:MAG: TonB-dependent receptor [Ignavibacteriales bacterium]
MRYIWILCLAFTLRLAGQSVIEGKITDDKLNPLPGANIILTGTDFGTASDQKGEFRITGLPSGEYRLRVSAIGYTPYESGKIILFNETRKINILLKEEVILTDQVIVTASKYEQQIQSLPVSAQVLQGSNIRNKALASLDQALRYIPGVTVTLDQVSIRGSSGYSRGAGTRVITALDGFPLYTGDTGEIIWEIFPFNALQRIEVIKGAASSIYGSNAIGGVINLITEEPKKNETYLRMYGGAYSDPPHDLWKWNSSTRYFNGLHVTQKLALGGEAGMMLSLNRAESDGYRSDDFYKRYSLFFKSDLPLTEVSALSLYGNVYIMERGDFLYWRDSRNALVPRTEDAGQRVNSNRQFYGAAYKHSLGNSLFLTNRLSYYRNKWDDQSAAANFSQSGLIRNDFSADYQITDKLHTIAGFEVTSGTTDANIFGDRTSFGTGTYIQAEYALTPELRLSGGIRYDYTKLDSLEAENALSPKLGLNYKLNPRLTLRLSAGTGFRAPSLAETFTQTNLSGIVIKPNPSLKSETVSNLEIGGNYLFAPGHSADVSLFYNEYKNFIEPAVDISDGQIRFTNLTDALISGYEVNLVNSISALSLQLSNNLMYLNTEDKGRDKAMKYRPKFTFTSSWLFSWQYFSLVYDFRYWSRVDEIDDELVLLGLVKDGNKRTEVFVSDITAGYLLGGLNLPVKVSFSVKNLFNYSYVEMIGNIAPIRNFSLNIESYF